MKGRALLGVLLACGCGLDEAGLAGDAGVDAAEAGAKDVTVIDVTPKDAADEDAPPPECNPDAPFGGFVDLGTDVDTSAFESSPFLTSDELTIFYARDVGGGRLALFYSVRDATPDPFGPGTKITTISSNATYDTAPIVDDGLTQMFFSSAGRPAGQHYHLYVATGDGTPNGWSKVTALTALESPEPHADMHLWIAGTTNELWFVSDRTGVRALYTSPDVKTFPTLDTWLLSTVPQSRPLLTADALTLYYGQADAGGVFHVFRSTRASTATPFVNPVQVTDFDSGDANDTPGWLSPDGCRMYFTSDRSGNSDIWMGTRGS